MWYVANVKMITPMERAHDVDDVCTQIAELKAKKTPEATGGRLVPFPHLVLRGSGEFEPGKKKAAFTAGEDSVDSEGESEWFEARTPLRDIDLRRSQRSMT